MSLTPLPVYIDTKSLFIGINTVPWYTGSSINHLVCNVNWCLSLLPLSLFTFYTYVSVLSTFCGVISKESIEEESFANGMLDYPQYTRPEFFDGVRVPEILLSGHHENIDKCRKEEALKVTAKKRPDILNT